MTRSPNRRLVSGLLTAAATMLIAVPKVSGQESPAATASAKPGQVTEESLEQMLLAMGLEPTKDKQRYDFRFKAVQRGEEWNLSMSAVLSQNGESIWLMAWLDPLPKSAADVPRTALLRLLADNDRLGNGKFFAYIPANRRFVLQRVVPNENVTTASFRDDLQDLGGSVADTYGHWSVANWGGNGASQTAEKDEPESTRSASRTAESPQRGTPVRNATRESSKFRGPTRR